MCQIIFNNNGLSVVTTKSAGLSFFWFPALTAQCLVTLVEMTTIKKLAVNTMEHFNSSSETQKDTHVSSQLI